MIVETEQASWREQIFSQRNLRIAGIFLVVFAIIAVLTNQTANAALRADIAANVPGDIEDIADEAFEVFEFVQESASAMAENLTVDTIGDAEALRDLLAEILDEDALNVIQTAGLHQPDGDSVIVSLSDSSSMAEANVERLPAGEFELDVPDGEMAWVLQEGVVRHLMPTEIDGTSAIVWMDVARSTLDTALAEGAAREELFAGLEQAYVLLVTEDGTVVAHYNDPSASSEQVNSLLGLLNEETLNADDEYYEVEADPIIDSGSFVSVVDANIDSWQVVGAYPISEVPDQSLVNSTANLFDVSEVGSTVSVIVDDAVAFLNEDVGWLFRGLRWPIEQTINLIEGVLIETPWFITILATMTVAALAGGRQVAIIAGVGMFVIGMLGLWELTMTTMAMILTSMAFCLVVGIPLGIWAARNDRVNEIVRAVLDAMQTIHPFVYLVPIVVLFGIGKVPGTIATIIFALPPMVRLTNLGIRQVPEDVVEAGRAFGSSDWQLLRDVQIPLALPSIMAGINQTLFLSLSMVVIVALIAGGGLGQEIYRAIGRADTGRAVVAGIAVLLLAVVIDRISQGGSGAQQAEE